MREVLSKVVDIFTQELGETVSPECEEKACMIYLKLYDTYVLIHELDEKHLRLYIAIEGLEGSDRNGAVQLMPYVKIIAPEGKGVLLACDLYSKLVDVEDYVVDCIAHLLEAFTVLKGNSGEVLLRNLLDLVEELASSGLSGREVYERLVNEYRIPKDIADAIVEAFYESTDD